MRGQRRPNAVDAFKPAGMVERDAEQTERAVTQFEEVVHHLTHGLSAIQGHGVGEGDAMMINDQVGSFVSDEFPDAYLQFPGVKMPDEDDRLNPHGKKVAEDGPALPARICFDQ